MASLPADLVALDASLDTLPVVLAAQILSRQSGYTITITEVEVDRAQRARAAVLIENQAHRLGRFVHPSAPHRKEPLP